MGNLEMCILLPGFSVLAWRTGLVQASHVCNIMVIDIMVTSMGMLARATMSTTVVWITPFTQLPESHLANHS